MNPTLVLNFHGIGPVPPHASSHELPFWLHLDAFHQILDLIAGRHDVWLTFDDGNASDFSAALPALLDRDLSARFFLCSDRIDQPGFLSSDHIREMADHGMRFGTHGTSHHSWRGLPPGVLGEEIHTSANRIAEVVGAPVNEAACPYGDYDHTVVQSLRSAGMNRVFTSNGGWWNGRGWIIPRCTIRASWSADDVSRLLASSHNVLRATSQKLRHLAHMLR